MTREEYKQRYVDYMVDQSSITKEEAEDEFECGFPITGMCGKDTEKMIAEGEPEDCVLEHMSYWGDN